MYEWEGKDPSTHTFVFCAFNEPYSLSKPLAGFLFFKALKYSQYLLDLMLMESQVKFYSPRNTSGASQQKKSIAAFY